MKKITGSILSLFLISGCTHTLENQKSNNDFVQNKASSFIEPKSEERTITVIQFRNGIAFAPNENEPFTGKYIGDDFPSSATLSFKIPSDGKKHETQYKNGERHGKEIKWFNNGQKNYEYNWQNGVLDGLAITWQENGQKEYESNYKNGKENGIKTAWHDNGQKNSEINYKDNKREGLHIVWSENGQKTGEYNYKNDKRDGIQTTWFKNGQKQTEELYRDGNKIKVISLFDENGNKLTPESVTPSRTQPAKTITSEVKIKPSKSPCDDISDLALQIMRGRQNGTAMSKMMQIAEDNKLIQAMVIAAYEKNRYSTEEVQTKIIEEFRDDAHLQCVKALRR